MSVDFPNEAARCQRFLSGRAQSYFARHGKGGPADRRSRTSFPLPLADPRAPSVISKRDESALAYKCLNLRAKRRCFRRPKVIVNHDPAAVAEQITVAIQIPAHIIVRIEDKQAYLAAAQTPTNFRDDCLVRGAPIDQSNVFRYTEPREVLLQILDNVPARQSEMFYTYLRLRSL